MTMVDDKETRVGSVSSLSTDYATIVPIKKRRFPIIPPPSPPPEDSCPSLEPVTEKQSESASASRSAAVLNPETDEGKRDVSASSQSAGPSSSLRRSSSPCVTHDKMEPLSVKLSLTNGECSVDCLNSVSRSETGTTNLCTNRSNWDLNTTMDAWEGSASDATSISTESLRKNIVGTADGIDVKPLRSSFEISGANASRKQTAASSVPSSEPLAYDNSLKLGLQIPFPANISRDFPFSFPGIDKAIFSRLSSAGSSSSVASVTVKSEPHEDPPRWVSVGSKFGDSRILGGKAIKHEASDQSGPGISQKSDYSTLGLFSSKATPVKAELAHEAVPTTVTTNEETSNKYSQVSQDPMSGICMLVNNSESISNRPVDAPLDSDFRVNQKASENVDKSATEIPEANESSKPNDAESSKAEAIHERDSSLKVNVESHAIDQEKLDALANVTETHCSSECGVDGNNSSNAAAAEKELCGREDNEYEDGEVQDQLMAETHVEPVIATPAIIINKTEDKANTESARNRCYKDADTSVQHNEASDMPLCSDMEESSLHEKVQMSTGLETHFEDLSDAEVDSKTNEPAPAAQETVIQPAYGNPIEDQNTGCISGEPTYTGLEHSGTSAHDGTAGKTQNIAFSADVGKNDSILPKIESSVHSDALGRDSNPESNRSRIVNLSTTFDDSSPGKTSSDRSMLLPDGRKRLPDIALEGDKMHPRRDEVSNSDFRRYPRERSREMFSRNSRSGFMRDRVRSSDEICTWESEREYGSEMHDGPVEFRASRYRYNSDYHDYNVAQEDDFVDARRSGRKIFNGHSPNFHRQHSIRRSHEGRDGHAARGSHMVGGRVHRNISPSRCVSMGDSELDGVRHGFSRREQNVGSFSGKGLHRIHSKSPVRLRSRSPVQWSPRRSPEGYVLHQDMPPRRSPPVYRRDKIGSPERVMMRRQNSPHYVSRSSDYMREMNYGRDHGFSRPMNSRNSSGRVPFRTRRYDMMNPRERTQGEYFRAPMRGRFHDLPGDEDTDERRQFN